MARLHSLANKFKEICAKIGCRHIQTLLIFQCMTVSFMMRVNLSVAIVAMTSQEVRNTTEQNQVEIYSWDKKTQDIILSSFLWGYVVMQIPCGRLAEKYGAKPLLIVTLLVNGFVTLIFPWAVRWGDWYGACICRVIQGITQSCIFPGLNAFGSRWFPLNERSRLLGLVASGSSLGTILGIVISSTIACELGWPSVFYFFGCLGLMVGLVWCCFAASTPSCHKSITEKEKDYIEASGCTNKSKAFKVPWRSVMTSVPYLAIIVAQIGSDFGHATFIMEMPSYMHKVLGIRIRENGLFSAMPYVAGWFTTIGMSFVSDYIVNRKILDRSISRKMFNTLGTWIPGILIIAQSYVSPNNPYVVIALLTVGIGFMSSVTMGFGLTALDIAPNFSGTLVGLSNCVSQSLSILAPISVGLILKDDTDPEQWQIIFFIIAGIWFVTNSVFLMFGSSQLQPWNEVTNEKEAESNNNTCQSEKVIPTIISYKDITLQI